MSDVEVDASLLRKQLEPHVRDLNGFSHAAARIALLEVSAVLVCVLLSEDTRSVGHVLSSLNLVNMAIHLDQRHHLDEARSLLALLNDKFAHILPEGDRNELRCHGLRPFECPHGVMMKAQHLAMTHRPSLHAFPLLDERETLGSNTDLEEVDDFHSDTEDAVADPVMVETDGGGGVDGSGGDGGGVPVMVEAVARSGFQFMQAVSTLQSDCAKRSTSDTTRDVEHQEDATAATSTAVASTDSSSALSASNASTAIATTSPATAPITEDIGAVNPFYLRYMQDHWKTASAVGAGSREV